MRPKMSAEERALVLAAKIVEMPTDLLERMLDPMTPEHLQAGPGVRHVIEHELERRGMGDSGNPGGQE